MDRPEGALEGLGTFAWKLSLATVLAVAGVAVILSIRESGSAPPESRAPPASAPDLDLTHSAREPSAPRAAPAAAPGPTATLTAIASEIERLHAAGELSEAQRRFGPCPGGDRRRVAWIDRDQRVRKLVQYRSSGEIVEQWYDEGGAVREVLVWSHLAGRPSTRRITVDARGSESTVDDPAGAAAEQAPPRLVRSDPGSAFFGGAGCER